MALSKIKRGSLNTGIDDNSDATAITIDSSENVLVGKTTADNTTQGTTIYGVAPGNMSLVRDQGSCLIANRLTNDGDIIVFRKDSSTVGRIGVAGTRPFFANQDNCGLLFVGDDVRPCNSDGTTRDNAIDLGNSGTGRFDDIFATGSVSTSDQNEKQQIASLTAAEITAAKAISKLFKTFKWNKAVELKGDAARTHTGVMAQEIETALTNAGLTAADYGFWCSDTWWEADETYTDDDGATQTRTNTYDTADEAPEGATQRTRLGIRYPELLAFIGAATEQRLADIETRLTALEDA